MTPRTVAPMGRKSTSACQATKAVSEGATSVAVIFWTSSHVSGRGSPSLSFAGRAKNSCKLSRAHDAERDLQFYQSFGLSLLPASCQIARLSKDCACTQGHSISIFLRPSSQTAGLHKTCLRAPASFSIQKFSFHVQVPSTTKTQAGRESAEASAALLEAAGAKRTPAPATRSERNVSEVASWP